VQGARVWATSHRLRAQAALDAAATTRRGAGEQDRARLAPGARQSPL
jgi:hypothetical protein